MKSFQSRVRFCWSLLAWERSRFSRANCSKWPLRLRFSGGMPPSATEVEQKGEGDGGGEQVVARLFLVVGRRLHLWEEGGEKI